MAIDMEEVLGPELMVPEAKETVMDILRDLPLSPADIKHAFFAWGRYSGYAPTAADAAGVAGTRKKRRPK